MTCAEQLPRGGAGALEHGALGGLGDFGSCECVFIDVIPFIIEGFIAGHFTFLLLREEHSAHRNPDKC